VVAVTVEVARVISSVIVVVTAGSLMSSVIVAAADVTVMVYAGEVTDTR
jgi:hypothetical protein